MKKNAQLTVANIYHLPWTAVEKEKGVLQHKNIWRVQGISILTLFTYHIIFSTSLSALSKHYLQFILHSSWHIKFDFN